MDILTINLAANEIKTFRKAGAYMEILVALGAIGITMSSVEGGQTNSINGGISGLFLQANFGAFTVQDQTGAPQTVQLLVCDPGEIGGSRRQPGVVQVVDTDKATTEQGAAFMGVNSTGAVGAAQFGTLLLWNPVGSGKKTVVERVYVDAQATATNIAAGIVAATVGVDAGTVASKLSGGVNSLAHIYTYGANASDPATFMAGHQAWAPTVAANGEVVLFPKRPFILMPGYGLLVGARVATAAITGTFEFWEQGLT